MRTIGVVTVGRSDYGHYLPLLRLMSKDKSVRLHLIAAGMHLEKSYGQTVRLIEKDGFAVGDRVPMNLVSDTPQGIARSMGLGLTGFSRSFARKRPDILVVLGDRFDMYVAAVAALPFKIPVAHLHGGEITEGAMDDSLRHSITKLSHLHFVSHPRYAQRVKRLGEEPWRITVSGAPGLDNLRQVRRLSIPEIEKKFQVRLPEPPLLVTYHPVTLEYNRVAWQVKELLKALGRWKGPIVITQPNADTGSRTALALIKGFVQRNAKAYLVPNLGTQGYFSLMALSRALVGNSSSGLIEAGSFHLPVVNVGTRQKGRLRGANVIDTDYTSSAVWRALQKATGPRFRAQARRAINPYGDGRAAPRILARLKSVRLDDRLLIKKFYDGGRA